MADAYIARHASALCIFILGKIIKGFKCKKRNVDILALFRKAKFVKTSEISVQVTLYIRWHVVCTITLKHLFRWQQKPSGGSFWIKPLMKKSLLGLILSDVFLYSIRDFIMLKFLHRIETKSFHCKLCCVTLWNKRLKLIRILWNGSIHMNFAAWVEERSLVLYLVHTYINTAILSLSCIINCVLSLFSFQGEPWGSSCSHPRFPWQWLALR